MIDDSKQINEQDINIVYDDTRMFRAVKTEEPAGWIEQEEFCWQAQHYDAKSLNEEPWERGSYYETPEQAIEAAKEGKRMSDMFSSLFG